MEAKKSRDYFRTIVGMANDLKEDMKNAKNLASTQLFFDKYAKRIERMPILGVDEELLKYSDFVADTLRQCTGSIKTMGIQSGVRQAQILGRAITRRRLRLRRLRLWRLWSYVDLYGDVKAAESQKRVIRAEEKAVAATDIQKLRQDSSPPPPTSAAR